MCKQLDEVMYTDTALLPVPSKRFSNGPRGAEESHAFLHICCDRMGGGERANSHKQRIPLKTFLWLSYTVFSIAISAQPIIPLDVQSTPLSLSSNFTESLTVITVNTTVQGDTTNAAPGGFHNFKKIDVTMDNIGNGGQSLFQINIKDGTTNLEISTCTGSEFDTYVALLDENPHNETAKVSVVSESGNDILCNAGNNRASLVTRVDPGMYYILVTGHGSQSGIFNLTVKGTKPSPTPLPWGLDRVDQRSLPLNEDYSVRDSGGETWVYIVDSGIRGTHEEFEGRALEGFDFVNLQRDSAVDCTGHGTHVAGIIAGKNFGIAKKAKVVAVRAFGCNNEARKSTLVNSIEWIIADVRAHSRRNVVIALMFNTNSLESSTLGHAIRGVMRSEIPVVVPAGNSGADACNFYPSSIEEFMSVGSTDITDARSDFSNSGNCTSIYAPGSLITSSWHTSDTASRVMSGTAQAAAHMAGIVANLLDLNNDIRAHVVNNVIRSISTKDIVKNVPLNDSTRFAFVRSVPEFNGEAPTKGNVFLFTIITIGMGFCQENSGELLSLRRTFGEQLSLPEYKVRIKCIELWTARVENTLENIEVRVDVPERKAASTFSILESLLGAERERTSETLGFSFTVLEKPWAVDSTPMVFWGAPSFSDAESFVLSKGAIAGAVVGAICVIAILVATSWIVYRNVRGIDDIMSMQGSADLEKGPVHFDDFENANPESLVSRSFRNVMRAMSFRRSSSMRSGFGAPGADFEKGMNRMGSVVGGGDVAGAKDMVRINSFGGEAFAGMDSISRSSSATNRSFGERSMRANSLSNDSLAFSFRGSDNLVSNEKRSRRENDNTLDNFDADLDEMDSMRMQSCGGEAFAMIGRQLSRDNMPVSSVRQAEGQSSSAHEENDRPIVIAKAPENETIAYAFEGLRQQSFFEGKR